MVEIHCRKNGCNKTDVELNHLIPRYMGGTDGDGRRYLCEPHHNILHHLIEKQLFLMVGEKITKDECRLKIKNFSLWYLEQLD